MICGKQSERHKRSADDLTKVADEQAQQLISSSSLHGSATDAMDDSTVHSITSIGGSSVYSASKSESDFSFVNETPSCITRELKQLPMQSRERVGQDLYGFSAFDTVEPHHFESLAVELDKIQMKHAYDKALQRSPDFVLDKSFRTMFLRATQGNAKAAAKRLVRHFETKMNLFGEDKLVKEIRLSDLDEYDMEALESGGFQVLSERDLAGRSVLFGRFTCMRYREIKNMLRALWYIWMTILEDEVNQIKGVVAVGYEIGRVPLERFDGLEDTDFEMFNADGGFDRDLAREIIAIPLSIPVRPVGYHLCTDSDQWVGILNMVMATLCKFIRLRMRIHHGSDQECKYQLMTHGLPAACIPVSKDGDVDLSCHMQWLEIRRHFESMLMDEDHALCF